jgi:hypothetical protein
MIVGSEVSQVTHLLFLFITVDRGIRVKIMYASFPSYRLSGKYISVFFRNVNFISGDVASIEYCMVISVCF